MVVEKDIWLDAAEFVNAGVFFLISGGTIEDSEELLLNMSENDHKDTQKNTSHMTEITLEDDSFKAWGESLVLIKVDRNLDQVEFVANDQKLEENVETENQAQAFDPEKGHLFVEHVFQLKVRGDGAEHANDGLL